LSKGNEMRHKSLPEAPLEECFASHRIKPDGGREAIFVDKEGNQVNAIKDNNSEADYFDWLETEYKEEKIKC
jgi:hypothetical protein